jgi:hypothetical protein
MDKALHYDDETLIRYLDGEMEPSEKAAFELQLKSDAVLKERIDKLRMAIAAVHQFGDAEKLRVIHREMMGEHSSIHRTRVTPVRKIVRYSMAVAAGILILFIGIRIFQGNGLSNDKLYNEVFVDFDASVVRGGEKNTVVAKLYQNNNYSAVVDESKKNEALSERDSLLVGLSFLKLNDNIDAIRWFNLSPSNKFRPDASFYQALAYLKNKDYQPAISLMESVHADQSNPYHDRFSDAYIDKVKKLSK